MTVCAVVCVRLMTCVPHAGYSAELWRFCTSTRVWERGNSTAAKGAGPCGGHVMTSVGLDLWVHGGYTGTGEGDARATHVVLLLSVAALRQRACLFPPSVTVCAVVCTAHDLCAA